MNNLFHFVLQLLLLEMDWQVCRKTTETMVTRRFQMVMVVAAVVVADAVVEVVANGAEIAFVVGVCRVARRRGVPQHLYSKRKYFKTTSISHSSFSS